MWWIPSSFTLISSLLRYQQGSTLLRPQQEAGSAHDRQRPLAAQLGQRLLHLLRYLLVGVVRIGVLAEALAQVDRRQHLDRDLGRQRQPPGEVEQVDAQRRADRDGEHLDAGEAVEADELGRALPAREEEGGLLPADGHHRHDRDVLLQREADEPPAAAELDLVAVPAGPERLVVAARIDEHGGDR